MDKVGPVPSPNEQKRLVHPHCQASGRWVSGGTLRKVALKVKGGVGVWMG